MSVLPLLFTVAACLTANKPEAPEPEVSSAPSAIPSRGALVIHVRDIPSRQGRIGYSVFSDPEGFPEDNSKAVRTGFVPVPEGRDAEIEIPDLPWGAYAVSVLQDENGNRKLDKNPLGIPKEPVGASNNPKMQFGPPKFGKAKFEFSEPRMEIDIKLRK